MAPNTTVEPPLSCVWHDSWIFHFIWVVSCVEGKHCRKTKKGEKFQHSVAATSNEKSWELSAVIKNLMSIRAHEILTALCPGMAAISPNYFCIISALFRENSIAPPTRATSVDDEDFIANSWKMFISHAICCFRSPFLSYQDSFRIQFKLLSIRLIWGRSRQTLSLTIISWCR